MPWQVMTRASAQAGNRASKTEHYLQWWKNSPEWVAVTSAAQKRHNSSFIIFLCDSAGAVQKWFRLCDTPVSRNWWPLKSDCGANIAPPRWGAFRAAIPAFGRTQNAGARRPGALRRPKDGSWLEKPIKYQNGKRMLAAETKSTAVKTTHLN